MSRTQIEMILKEELGTSAMESLMSIRFGMLSTKNQWDRLVDRLAALLSGPGADRKGEAMSQSSSSSGGIGLVTALTVTFVILKALDKLDWSWWWVFAPIWISGLIWLVVMLVVGIGFLVVWLVGR